MPAARVLPAEPPLSRREYDRRVSARWYVGEPIELLRGRLVRMSPQGDPHSDAVAWLAQRLGKALEIADYDVRAHAPFAATDDSEPEPDVQVSRRSNRRRGHPRRALLLVEVSVSSLRKDRTLKAEIYAENGAPEYWVVDVRRQLVHVYSKPRHGRYTSLVAMPRDAVLRPTRVPFEIAAAELFEPGTRATSRRRGASDRRRRHPRGSG